MKFSLKTLAAAVAVAAASAASAAPIDNGANGNGGLFFNIWDGAMSYTLNLGFSIDSFESTLAQTDNINLSFAADETLTTYLKDADKTKLKWNVLATDTKGDRRVLETFTTATATVNKDTDQNFRSIAGGIQGALTGSGANVNSKLISANSATFSPADRGYLGQAALGANFNKLQTFDNTGTLANNSFASGLNFMRVDAKALNAATSKFNQYADGGNKVSVYFDASNTLHIAAVPEPESYAMLLAGLGMLGFMARRRLNNRV